jgi:Ser-tRNA(Ala) deacylase AlaX
MFWDDPYLTALDTRIAAATDDAVTVERTIFYALSGGQESDHGTIGGRPVLEALKDGKEIAYRLGSGHGLKPGDPVTMTIDGERRYRLMRLHFAAELVLELVCRALPSIEKIGAHIAEDKARIDFLWGENIAAILPAMKQAAQEIIDADREIVSAFSDEAGERRYWEVPGFSRVPCGGTHLRITGEIGTIELKRRNVGKGKERIEIRLGRRPAEAAR